MSCISEPNHFQSDLGSRSEVLEFLKFTPVSLDTVTSFPYDDIVENETSGGLGEDLLYDQYGHGKLSAVFLQVAREYCITRSLTYNTLVNLIGADQQCHDFYLQTSHRIICSAGDKELADQFASHFQIKTEG